MMGDGFGIHPTSGIIYAPIAGKITMVADTKHGLEVLIHMGIDTVELAGIPFKIDVQVGDMVQRGQVVAQMDIDKVKAASKDPTVIVVITNVKDMVESMTVTTGYKKAKEVVATVKRIP